ncbi:CLUMA_CG004206, isoform A [Clunio marinus]|uniref:CLUMA_CG004206, isoform A n=1 Tax=Clunio marinus TaxID=568069 RepID=A0A1J1HR89_9DIPT|nr:CLUMA_CG004206, isoform A [Clunio marinus]
MGLFNSLHSTFTSYKVPKMKLNDDACHTAKDLQCQQKRKKKRCERDSQSIFRACCFIFEPLISSFTCRIFCVTRNVYHKFPENATDPTPTNKTPPTSICSIGKILSYG